MTVGDVLKNVGIMIGRQDVTDFFGEQINIGNDTYEDVLLLLKILNIVVSELSSTYLPLVASQEVEFYNGEFAYLDLEKKVVKIVDVHDCLGNKVAFKEDVEVVKLEGSYPDSTMLTICYQYMPEDYYEDSEIGYSEKDIPARVIAYGVAAEYCINQARFEEAVMHHNRYVLGIQEMKGPKNKTIKSRSWK